MEASHTKTATNSGEDSDTTVDGFFVKDDVDTSTTKVEKPIIEMVGDSRQSLPKPMTETQDMPRAENTSGSTPKGGIQPDLGNSCAKVDGPSVAEISGFTKSVTLPVMGTTTVAELTAEAIAESALSLAQNFAHAPVEPLIPSATLQEQPSQEHPAHGPFVPTREPQAPTPSSDSQSASGQNLPDHLPILKLAPRPPTLKKQVPRPVGLMKQSRTASTPLESGKRPPQRHSQKQLLKLAPKPSPNLKPDTKAARLPEPSHPKPQRLVKKGKPKKQPPRQPYASTVRNPTQNPRSFKLQTVGPRQIGGIQDQAFAHRTPACSCGRDSGRMMTSKKKTACLKLFCPCFSHGSYCTERCACSSSCSNHSEAEEIRTQAISETLYKDSNAFRLEAGKTSDLQRLVHLGLFRGDLPGFLANDQSFAAQNPDAFVRRSLLSTQLPPSYYTMPCKGSNGKVELRSISFSLTGPHKAKGRAKRKRLPKDGAVMEPDASDKRRILLSPTGLETRAAKVDNLATKYLSAVKEKRHPDSESAIGDPLSDSPISSVAADVMQVKDAMDAAHLNITTRLFKGEQLQTDVVNDGGFAANGCALPEDHNNAHLYCREDDLSPYANIGDKVAMESVTKSLIVSVAEDTAMIQETSKMIRRLAHALCARRTRAKKK